MLEIWDALSLKFRVIMPDEGDLICFFIKDDFVEDIERNALLKGIDTTGRLECPWRFLGHGYSVGVQILWSRSAQIGPFTHGIGLSRTCRSSSRRSGKGV